MMVEVSRKQDYIFSSKKLRENAARSGEIAHVTGSSFFQERLGSSINGTPSSIYIIYQQNTHSNDTFGYRKCIFQISFPLKCIQLFL